MTALYKADIFIQQNGEILKGEFGYEPTRQKFSSHPLGKTTKKLMPPFFTDALPVEVHIHGIDSIDFSAPIDTFDLDSTQAFFFEEGVVGLPTIFLAREDLDGFVDLMKRFSGLKKKGKLENIIGLALEGPILSSNGGTPLKGTWFPTDSEWEKLATCGALGLKYMVISPDWPVEKLLPVAELLLTHGVYLCLGHSRQDTAREAVVGIHAVVDLAVRLGFKPGSGVILVDHLLNDMPQRIEHAWRTPQARRARHRELIDMDLDSWTLDSLPAQIGEVPGTLIQLAQKGLITLFLNFDGHHVDLQICRRVYELVGSANIIPMTDRIETNIFGGQHLTKKEIGTLWYQKDGTVAVGSSTIDEQMTHMRSLQISERDIWQMCVQNPNKIFRPIRVKRKEQHISYTNKRHMRVALDAGTR